MKFYKFFYDLLGNDLLACLILNEAYEKQDPLHNWRPITLLNVYSKIAAKARAKRLETVLPNLIHRDQTGFVNGRYIGENIRLISDVQDLTNKQQIVALDFRKAFVSLEWLFIMATLNSFNFGTGSKQYVLHQRRWRSDQ